MFRYDASRLGRFLTPDPLAGSIGDPQSLNRYVYVRNDPVNLTDPWGLFFSPCQNDDAPGEPSGGGGSAGGSGVSSGSAGNANNQTTEAEKSAQEEEADVDCDALRRQWRTRFSFVEEHLDQARAVAAVMGTPVANILGLSALESGNGTGRIATEANNYFGLLRGSRFALTVGEYNSPNGNTYGVYPDPGFMMSGLSLATSSYRVAVGGETSPSGFASALAESGYNSESNYVGALAFAINNVQEILKCLAE